MKKDEFEKKKKKSILQIFYGKCIKIEKRKNEGIKMFSLKNTKQKFNSIYP